MKRIIIAFVMAISIGAAVFTSTLWYFKHRTGLSLIEVFHVQSRCQFINTNHCNRVYYFLPDNAYVTHNELEVPESTAL